MASLAVYGAASRGWSHPRSAGLLALTVALLLAVPAAGSRFASERELIAFVRGDGIYAMRPDGSGVRRLRTVARVGDLAWSPDGRRLAYTADGAIWVMNADGTHAVRLTPRVRTKFGLFIGPMSPSWSPDGRKLAYTYSASAKDDRNVWLMNADGTNRRRLARTRACGEIDVDWSPKTASLAVTCLWGWGSRHILLLRLDGGVRPLVISGRAMGADAPDWSPDGTQIVFAEFWPNRAEISIADASDGSLTRLTDDGALSDDPVWSPDGKRIAFTRLGKNGGIYVMNAPGNRVVRLTGATDSGNARSPAWQPVSED